jgi:2-polyprenyl-3-methyl-5-hydroxy-6-metoxy-1,4-benzoquinol methylase
MDIPENRSPASSPWEREIAYSEHMTKSMIGCGWMMAILVGVPAAIALIIFLSEVIPHFFSLLKGQVKNDALLAAICSGFTLLFGTGLFYLRKSKRKLYSILEIVFAMATIWVATIKLEVQGDLSVWLAIGASAYLMVRGLDNWYIALEEDANKRLISLQRSKKMNPEMTTEMEALKSKLRATWIAGDFGEIARSIAKGGEEFVERLNLTPGMKVLDVACGTGNLAIPAARTGADVTGVDIAPNLIDQARANAEAEGLNAKFEVGDAEAMPYADGEFDVVMTMFGAMFAPRPDVTAGELIRVCKPGGRIAMANWTPAAFTGQMFKTNAKYVPPPLGMPSPLLWADEAAVRERFAEGVSDLQMTRREITFTYPFGPAEVVEHFRKYFGPTQKSFESLDDAAQDALRKDLVELWTEHNHANDGTTAVTSEYLEVIAVRA